MATGDLKNNMRKLKTELRLIKYNDDIPWQQINIGLTEPLLPILHYVFGDFSCEFTSYLGAKGYDFFCKSDLRFIEIIYKILIMEFSLKPMLTKQQFFAVGFAEIKVIFLTKIISLCRIKNNGILAKLTKARKQNSKIQQAVNSVAHFEKIHHDFSVGIDFHIEQEDDPAIIAPKSAPGGHLIGDSLDQKINHDMLDLTLEVDEILVDGSSNLANYKNIDNDSTNTARDVLDVTEIDDEENIIVRKMGIESQFFIDDNIDGSKLPQFAVLKHVLPEVHLVEESDSKKVNIPIETKMGSESTPESCGQCAVNLKCITAMVNRIATLEKQFAESIKLNNELSAKMILLETKVNLLKHPSNVRIGIDQADPGNGNPNSSTVPVPENEIEPQISYSPLKYSDDEIIMKDFRPITMIDVRNSQRMNRHLEKENFPPVKTNEKQVKPTFSSFSNRKISFDSKTKETISNVQRYFQDADQLLAVNSSAEIY